MHKHIFLSLSILALLCGCSATETNSKPKEIIKGEMNCTVEEDKFTLMLENGQIVKYIDSVEGELGQETVDILNEEYLVGVTDNEEAVRIMNESLKDLEGHCE